MPVRQRNAVCPRCDTPGQLLYQLEPTDAALGLACASCCRRYGATVHRVTLCDTCGAPGAWRNPFTRRDEYFCANHHAASGDGVVLNKWFPRVSNPHSQGRRVQCAVRSNDCRGEVKPRGPAAQLLCTRHAGKRSAAWDVEDGLV